MSAWPHHGARAVQFRTAFARACSMLLILLLAGAIQSCGRGPADGTPTPTSAVRVESTAVTLPASSPAPERTPSPLSSPSPLAAPAIVEVIELGGPAIPGRNPLAVVASSERIYVANEGSRNVAIVQDGRVVTALALGQGPYRLATDTANGTVYLAAEIGRSIYVLEEDEIADVWPLAVAPTAITVSDGQVWVGGADGTIHRLDARSGQSLSTDGPLEDGMIVDLVSLESGRVVAATFSQVHLYAGPSAGIYGSRSYAGYRAIAAAANLVYVCAYDRVTGTTIVEELDGTSLALQRSLTVADDAAAIAFDARRDHLFVSGSVSNRVELIDMARGVTLASAIAGLSPQRLAFDTAADQVIATYYESDTLATFAAGELSLVELVPLTLRVTALAPGHASQGVIAGLNTGSGRSLTDRGQSVMLTGVGYPGGLVWLPNGAGLAVLDRAAAQVVVLDDDGVITLQVDTARGLESLYVDPVAGNLYAGDTIVSLDTGATASMGMPADPAVGSPVQVLRDTRRNRLYAVALNGIPGSNGGYVAYRQDGSNWETTGVPGRLSVLDIVYDQETDRFFAANGQMGVYGIQVYDPETMRELHYLALQAPPVAMLLNGPYHHLWIATLVPATGSTLA
ncbi:MAG: NHL repeat-containing protein, partial [Anaerolineae bacterium]